MEVSERIKVLRKYFFADNNINFASFMGEKTSTTSGWVSGKRGIGKSVLEKILAKLPQVSPAWLLTGEGEMLRQPTIDLKSDASVITPQGNELYLETSSGMKYFKLSDQKFRMRVPLVPLNAYARYISESCEAVSQDPSEWDEIEFIVKKIGHGNYMGFEIKGDSMDDDSRRSFAQGDLVLARELDRLHWTSRLRYNTYPYWVIVLNHTILCKEIVAHNVETGDITCHSLNPSPEYSDFTVNLGEVCRLFNIIQKTSTI